ncbi:collagen-binding protein [Parapedobacter pyrenivorans]|uniref:Collagen-binding protein n=1 Tax=Parapedobacter pyrenivorans TaxID=1305674 RepID=A0A917MCU5_9SPHI|nr:TonB-dependent receptor [Parapedobacter pyrenivorans]GGG94699.1 collagen-binding protein [Parapedobacter pyrenivorans]
MQNRKINIYLLFISLFMLCSAVNAHAQQGIVKGKIKDAATDGLIIGASVTIVGSTHGTISGDDGTFLLTAIPAGQHVLQVSYVGYSTIRVDDIIVKEGAETILDIKLEASGELMDEVVVTTTRKRGTDIALLAEQKKASLVIQRIGAQELSRIGASDAANAVAKMSGISKEEGGTQVYIRGMGDRYNATSFNGLPLPSNDPKLKNIALDLFSTDVIEFVAVDKLYNSKMFGDFGGGNIDIYSKDYSGNGMLEVSVSSTLNTNAISHAGAFAQLPNGDRWGFSQYSIPENPLGGFNFTNSANPVSRNPYPANVRVLGGKSFNVGGTGRLNFFGTASFGNGFEYREGVNNDVSAQGARIRWSDQTRFGYKTNTTGLFNAKYLINPMHKLSYNFLFVNSSDQWNDNYNGYFRDITEGTTGLRRLGSYAQNRVFVNQLLGTHQLSSRIDVDWGVSANRVAYIMPDRIENVLRYVDGEGYRIAEFADSDNNRFNQRLDENEYAVNLNGSYKIGNTEAPGGIIRLGYQGRLKKREFESIQFNFEHTSQGRSVVVDPNNLDALYNQNSFASGYFNITGFAGESPQLYSGDQQIHAGYVSLEYDLTDRLTSVVGVRYENIRQYVDWVTQFFPDGGKNTLTKNPILPSLNLKYELNEKQNLRLGASKTYTLPQFKERAPFVFDDGTVSEQGNPFLYPSDNYNLDIKWEMFPSSSELISLAAFGKYVQNPINEISIAATANDISWVNIGDVGTVIGVELEAKKDLVKWNSDRNLFSAGLNVAYMKTDQDINTDKVRQETRFDIRPTHNRSNFTGASDLLVNADLTYTKRWRNDGNIMATVAYSYFSDKIYSLGIEQKGNLVDRGVGTLDFIIRSKINRRIGVDLLLRNILDPEYRRTQENANGHVPVLTYKKGQFFSLGVNYQL